jgi:hypothetical protein
MALKDSLHIIYLFGFILLPIILIGFYALRTGKVKRPIIKSIGLTVSLMAMLSGFVLLEGIIGDDMCDDDDKDDWENYMCMKPLHWTLFIGGLIAFFIVLFMMRVNPLDKYDGVFIDDQGFTHHLVGGVKRGIAPGTVYSIYEP